MCGQGNLNLITQALAAVGCEMEVIPDPTTVHYHLPDNLSVRVHREYNEFISELTAKFPHEKEGILKFFGECWKVLFFSLSSVSIHFSQVEGEFFWVMACLVFKIYISKIMCIWIGIQCLELIGTEVTRGTNLPFWTVLSEAC